MYSISIYFGNLSHYKHWNYRGESALLFAVNKVTVSCESQILMQETVPHNENCYSPDM